MQLGLNEWEMYLTIKHLLLNGYKEQQIADELGKSRTFVQMRRWVAQLPECVEQHYREQGLTFDELRTLFKAMNEDKRKGDTEGTRFTREWAKLAH